MQPIHVSRYSQPTAIGYQGSIMPADRSWIVFVTTEGTPQLFLRMEVKGGAEQVEHDYVNALDLRSPHKAPAR